MLILVLHFKPPRLHFPLSARFRPWPRTGYLTRGLIFPPQGPRGFRVSSWRWAVHGGCVHLLGELPALLWI